MHLAFERAHRNFRSEHRRLKESEVLDLAGEAAHQ